MVDDEQHVLSLTARMLRDEGYTVAVATSAELALEWLATAEPVDLVLADIAMPGMNGMKMAEALQTLYPGQRIALMSGFIGVIAKIGFRGSPYPVLVKPFTQSQLAQRVREALTIQ